MARIICCGLDNNNMEEGEVLVFSLMIKESPVTWKKRVVIFAVTSASHKL